MSKRGFIFLFLIITFCLIGTVLAENQTEDQNVTNPTENLTNTNLTEINGISLINFFPTETEVGNVQFDIQIRNDGNQTINNIIAFISGRGYSSYNIIPIDSLDSGEKSYLFVYGNLKESGNITLTLRIDREIFYKNITVENPNEQILTNAEKELENLSQQIDELKSKYASLEFEISEKKDNNYDVSNIDLNDMKEYIRDAEASVFSKDLRGANSNLKLAVEEYKYQKNKTDAVKLIPTISKVKDYALIFSAIAGSILAFFAIYELLIRKSLGLAKFGKTVVTNAIKKKKGEDSK